MVLEYKFGDVEIDWQDAKKVIKEELNKMSREELITFIFDRDGGELDLQEYFREEITKFYKKDCWED